MSAEIRKIVTIVDEVLTEMGRPVDPPIRRAAALAVIANPSPGTMSRISRPHRDRRGTGRAPV